MCGVFLAAVSHHAIRSVLKEDLNNAHLAIAVKSQENGNLQNQLE